MKPADREVLLQLQREALAGNLHALQVARDLQEEHGVPYLTPAEEVGIAAYLTLGRKTRRLPHDRGDARNARRMRRRITMRRPGPPLDDAERRYLHELLHVNPAPMGAGRHCYAHPYRTVENGVVGKYLHESACACWTRPNQGLLPLLPLRGEAGDTLTITAYADGLFPTKIFVTEDGHNPDGATALCNVFIGAVNQLPTGQRLDSRYLAPNNLGSGVRMDRAAPGMPVAVTVYFHRACTFQCVLVGQLLPATIALNFAGVTPNPNVLGTVISWPTSAIAQQLRAEGRI